MTDAKGPRLVVVGGMLVSALGLFVLAFIRSEIELYIAWSLLFSAGVAAGFTVALDKLVVASVTHKRGMALAVRFSIAAIVSTLLVPIVTFMIEHIGWRQTCLVWGGVILLLIPVPLIWFQAERIAPPRASPPASDPAPSPKRTSVRSVLRRFDFWIIAIALTAQASVTTGLSVHLLPLMTDYGLDAVLAGTLFGGMILLTIPVRLLAGYISDRLEPRLLPFILGGLLVLEGIAIGSFAIAPGFATMLIVICALGIAAGAPMVLVRSCASCSAERLCHRTSSLMTQVPGTMLAPILAGYVYDFSGSYVGVIAAFGLTLVLGGSLLGLLRVR